jgi:DNA-directed RNA polymerase specialized sigma24 family protein
MENTELYRLFEKIRTDEKFESFIEELFDYPGAFGVLMAKTRELKTLRVNDLRIMAFESIDGILPFQQEGGEVKRLTFSTDPGKRRTFAEWENFEEGIKSYIGHPTPDGFIGIAHKDEDFDACEQRQKRNAQRHNEKKQIAASVIARAILSLLTDERIAQKKVEAEKKPAESQKSEHGKPMPKQKKQDFSQMLQNYIYVLSDKQLQAISLRLEYGMSLHQIADMMKCAKSTAKGHVDSATKIIQKGNEHLGRKRPPMD